MTKSTKSLADIINDALNPGVFGDGPPSQLDPLIDRQCGELVRGLCERFGYGAMLHHVEALWRERAIERGHPGSEHSVAGCRATREAWISRAKAAMQRYRQEPTDD